jgi:hypothetical protein
MQNFYEYMIYLNYTIFYIWNYKTMGYKKDIHRLMVLWKSSKYLLLWNLQLGNK